MAATGLDSLQLSTPLSMANMGVFVSAEQTGTGSAQNIAHGKAVVPAAVVIVPTDTSPATAGVFVVTQGTHTTTNVVVTVTTSKKFQVLAFF